MLPTQLQPLRQFREQVYQSLSPSRDAAFELIDAIADSPTARSAVEVSLSPGMQRRFSSVYKGLERTRLELDRLRGVLVQAAETQGDFRLAGYAVYALDHTPYPRRQAPTVADRGYVHGAEGQVIGHQYSLLGRVMHRQGAWVGVVDWARIPTTATPVQAGAAQVQRLKQLAKGPILLVADSEYGTTTLLDQADAQLAMLVRLKGNRVLYEAPPPRPAGTRGRPRVHGPRFPLRAPARSPDLQLRLPEPDGGWVVLSLWQDLYRRQRPQRPLSAIRVEVHRADGSPRFHRPLWLAWTGPTHGLDWATFWQGYLRRCSLEAVHQFTKNSLAWTRARLGATEREERWTGLVMLAYWHLLLALPAARDRHRPWERPTPAKRWPSPARVQRDMGRIFALLGSPVRPPKPRGNPLGRPRGYHPTPRPRYSVIHKRAPPG